MELLQAMEAKLTKEGEEETKLYEEFVPCGPRRTLGLHITWGVDEIDTQISQETLGNHENP